MKTTRILLFVTTLLLFPWCGAQVFAQQTGAKKIVITKRTVEADGSENTETIVKKGAAAQKFDLDKYIADNKADNAQLDVQVTGDEEERSIVIKGSKTVRAAEEDEAIADDDQAYAGDEGYSGYKGHTRYEEFELNCDNSAFLGVNEDSDEDANAPGLVVNVVRGSAADFAGLRDNDKIMKLNETPTNRWSDLSKFVNASKPGDKVMIAYERNGKAAQIEATLTRRNEVKSNLKYEPKGFLGVSNLEKSSENSKPGVAVYITKGSAADKAGLQKGDVIYKLNDTPIADFEDISDFMAYTKGGDKVSITYERNGKRNKAEAVLASEQNTWNINTDNWDLSEFDPEKLLNNAGINIGNCSVTVNKKDACLGVYSDDYAEDDIAGSEINGFTETSAALEANLAIGDVITAINGKYIKSQQELWNEIARYKVGDKVRVEYLRDNQALNIEAKLKACKDNSSRVEVLDGDGEEVRNFTSWNWNDANQNKLRERSIITIRKGEGDATKVNAAPGTQASAPDRSLKLTEFRAYPNPTQGQLTVEFAGNPVATIVSFFDLSGRQLFREELNVFNGRYSQFFDLSDYAKENIVIQIQQGEQRYTEQLNVN